MKSGITTFPGPADRALFAVNGCKIITDTATHTGPFAWAEVITAAVVNTATTTNAVGSLNGRSYAAGSTFRFQIDTLKLDSGEVHAYYRDPGMIEGVEGGEGAPFQF